MPCTHITGLKVVSGFNEPDAIAVIGMQLAMQEMVLQRLIAPGKASDEDDHVFHLFVRPKDPKAEQWDGARSGTQAALDIFNADEVRLSGLQIGAQD